MSDTTAQALAEVVAKARAERHGDPMLWWNYLQDAAWDVRLVLESGLVVPAADLDTAIETAQIAERELDTMTAELAEANATITRVEAECAKWERRAPDGYPIEPWAIDLAKRLRRALDGDGG